MIPDFLQSTESANHVDLWKTIIGLFIVFVGTFIGVEIRVEKDEEES